MGIAVSSMLIWIFKFLWRLSQISPKHKTRWISQRRVYSAEMVSSTSESSVNIVFFFSRGLTLQVEPISSTLLQPKFPTYCSLGHLNGARDLAQKAWNAWNDDFYFCRYILRIVTRHFDGIVISRQGRHLSVTTQCPAWARSWLCAQLCPASASWFRPIWGWVALSDRG